MKISEAFDKGLIPSDYIGELPTHCKCGAELEVSESLTKIWCPSDKCTYKQIARLNAMLTNFGVKDIGLSYCKSLWNEMERCGLSDSHMNVFRLPLSEYPEVNKIEITEKKFNAIQSVVRESFFNSGYTLGDIVANMALPGMDLTARKLFAGFNSVKDMFRYANAKYGECGMLRLIQSKFGTGVTCIKIAHVFAAFGKDLELIEEIFNIRKSSHTLIKVAITGRISQYGNYTRKEFIKECNKICNGVAEIVDTGVNSDIQFVIADSSSESSKYMYGEEYGILISSTEFVNWLRSEVV